MNLSYFWYYFLLFQNLLIGLDRSQNICRQSPMHGYIGGMGI